MIYSTARVEPHLNGESCAWEYPRARHTAAAYTAPAPGAWVRVQTTAWVRAVMRELRAVHKVLIEEEGVT